MRRLVFALVAGAVLSFPAVASAHEEINPNVIATGKPTFFSLSAANEKSVNLTGITLKAPDGVPFGETTREPAGWTVAKSEDALTWNGGAVKPGAFESWGFEIEGADQPGTLHYTATLKFADGNSEDVKIDVTAQTGATDGGGSKAASNAKSRANTAMVLAWVALAAAIVAMLLAVLGRRSGSNTTSEQNW